MRTLTCIALLLVSQSGWCAERAPVPTVIVNIHAAGADRVMALKREPGVIWSAEFGNELLLGVSEKSLPGWLARARVMPGPDALAFDEVVVREHDCTAHDQTAPLAVVGGYEILRMPAAQAKATRGPYIAGEPLPDDGVIAREVFNQPGAKAAGASQIEIENLIRRIDADRWFDTMSGLAAFNRNSFNPLLIGAHNWVLQRFEELPLETQSFEFNLSVSSTTCNPPPAAVTLYNPIGFKRGETLPDEWIIVGGHYDARNTARCETSATPVPQPGANDNASGCAGVIELARVFAGMATERSILFMCFAGEEQGLVGSQRYATSLVNAGLIQRVRHMINLDMIGHALDDSLAARVDTTPAQAAVLPIYSAAASTYAPELGLITSTMAGANSDHWPFLNLGVPGAFTWENGASIYPHYHQSTDLPANMQRARPLAHGILKMDAAVLAGVAGLLPLFADGLED